MLVDIRCIPLLVINGIQRIGVVHILRNQQRGEEFPNANG